jgi:hypothetical protein
MESDNRGRENEMAVRRNSSRTGRTGSTTRKAAPAEKAAPRRNTNARTKAAPAKPQRDVTVYAEKPATPYHKAFARWIVEEVGLDLSTLSVKSAFLKGVSIATAARPAFNESDFLEEWREKSGETKRGPKPKAEAEKAAPARGRKAKPAPVEEDEFDDDDDEFGDEQDDDEFDDDDNETDSDDDDDFDDDDSDDDSDEDDDEFDDDDEDDEPAPPVKLRTNSRARKATPARSATSKRTPAKAASKPAGRTAKAKAADDDDDFLF